MINNKMQIIVHPNKKESKVIGKDDQGRLIVHVSSPAKENKANKELLKVLKKEGIKAVITHGLKSRIKTVRVLNT